MKMDKKNISCLMDEFCFVVPEIQREYVWGNPKNRRILVQFVKDLDAKLGKGDTNIGFLYSYVSGDEHYLIDGQQRYTTLLLLCYYLSSLESEKCHSNFVTKLRLDNNLNAFSYRVRSYTESFLQNLFRSGVYQANSVRDQVWFKNEYNNDPTISAMIGALDTFGKVIDMCPNLRIDNILEHVCFWYFDVNMTSQGEELYITMNSRGEKLTDSEQIKPRLFRKEQKGKEYFGKKWDDWEEFFYDKSLRAGREIKTIDTAMNNIIRIVLELKSCGEHDRINPVDDAELISLGDIENYMNALSSLSQIDNSRYLEDVAGVYGDNNSDGNFYVLKAMLTEMLKGQEDLHELERVYQTVKNHVRRNKLKNKPFLVFLRSYFDSSLSWYDFILDECNSEVAAMFNGHELDKIKICREFGENVERAIWTEQSRAFWNGEIKLLMTWASVDGNFELSEFSRISNNFNLLFDQRENSGWTSDNVRQALITCLAKYPLNGCFFGYTSDQWKQIMWNNSQEFLIFLNKFDSMDKAARDVLLLQMKNNYPEIPENTWAEFVHHDYLFQYCNTKRIQYREEYGIECVMNQYKQPCSVKNMHLEQYLKRYINEMEPNPGCWSCWIDKSGWKSTVKIYKDPNPIRIWIQYRKDQDEKFEIELFMSDLPIRDQFIQNVANLGFTYNDNRQFKMYVESNMEKIVQLIKQIVSIEV